MRNRQPVLIKEILKTAKLNNRGQTQQQKIQKAWVSVVGHNTAQHTQLHSIKGANLTINVDSPIWIYQLNIKKRSIEEQLQNQLHYTKPIKIKLRAGETPRTAVETARGLRSSK